MQLIKNTEFINISFLHFTIIFIYTVVSHLYLFKGVPGHDEIKNKNEKEFYKMLDKLNKEKNTATQG